MTLAKASTSDQTTTSSSKAKSMADLMASFSSKIKPLKKGDIIEGRVKKLTSEEITLDIGAKSDALVLEFDKQNVDKLLRFLKQGDTVRASVLSPESEEGFPVVSLRRTLDDIVFSKLEDAVKNQGEIEVEVLESTKGGFFAQTSEGTRGFLPNSQIVDHDIVGKKIRVKIIEFDKSKKRIIFSHKATVYVINPSQISRLIKKDEIYDVTVNNVATHGLYVTIEKDGSLIEGFIHISEVSYQRIENLQSDYKKGDVLKAQVLDIDFENRRVNLSLKKLEKDSFEDVKAKYKKEQKVKGIIKAVKGKGVTVELEDNIFGFIPESKIPSQTSYNVGDKLESTVEDFDDKHRMVVLTPVLKEKPIGYR